MLNGGAGTDTMVGGAGNDTYVVDNLRRRGHRESANAGTDTGAERGVTSRWAANLENLTLTGAAAINGTGNDLDNILTGNSATNMLTAAPATTPDRWRATTPTSWTCGDAHRGLNAGTDTVQSSVSYTLGANVENLTLTGAGAINGTGNDSTTSSPAMRGNNMLNGGVGSDTMIGGRGNDTYVVDNLGDTVTEKLNAGAPTRCRARSPSRWGPTSRTSRSPAPTISTARATRSTTRSRATRATTFSMAGRARTP